MCGPLLSHGPGARGEDADTDALARISLRLLSGYLAITLTPLLAWSVSAGSWLQAAAHTAALAVTLLAGSNFCPTPRTLRDWIPLGLGPFLYIELRWIIEGAGRPHSDRIVAGWESAVFASEPSHSLALRWRSFTLSELLQLCYLSYYPLIYVPPALLWLRGRRRDFAETVLALVVVYAICFVVYMLFPVDGPRFVHGPSLAPAGPIRAIVIRLLDSGSSRGTAFPSSHVAASVVATLCALRFQRMVGVLASALTVGLAVGAVYGGYHYGVDVLAGAVTGVTAMAAARAIATRSTAAR